MATASASSQTLRGRSWKPENDLSAASRQNRAKRIKRIIWTVLGLFLLLLLWILLAGPFYLPRPQVFAVMQGDYDLLSVPRVGFTGNDEAALDALDPALYANRRHRGVHHLPASQTADRLVQLHNQLEMNVSGRSDVVMVYLRAQGIGDDGEAYLLGSDYDLNNPSVGRAPLRQVLTQISRCSAAVKILFLDQGGLDYNPRMGVLVNEFSELLKRDVAATRDSALWVMTAHSSLERSHLVFPWRRSIFGYFLTEGLKGAADANRDSGVDMMELFQFVSSQQANFVNTLTGGSETQTPMLLWGGGLPSTAVPYLNLVTIPKGFGVSAVQLLDAKAALQGKAGATGTGSGATGTAPAATGAATPAGTKSALLLPARKEAFGPSEALREEHAAAGSDEAAGRPASTDRAADPSQNKKLAERRAATAEAAAAWLAEAWWHSRPSVWVAYQGPALGSASGTASAGTAAGGTAAGTSASTAAGTATPAGTTAAASTSSGTAATTGAATTAAGSAPAGTGTADAPSDAPQKTPRQLVHEMLDDAWRVVDALETRSEENPWSPIDYAPHLWREYVESLTAYEARFLSGFDYLGKDDAGEGLVSYQTVLRDLATHLRGRLLPLRAVVQNEPLPLGTLEASIAYSLYQARPKPLPEVDRPRTMAAVKWFPWPAGSTIAREAAATRAEWLAFLDRKQSKGFAEWAAEQYRRHPEWLELQFATSLASQLDRVDWDTAVLALRAVESRERIAASAPWIRPWLDSRWEEAESRSWTAQKELLNPFERDLERPRNLLRGALSTFRVLDDETQMLLAAQRLRNDLTFRLPYYLHWNAEGRGYRVAYAPQNADVEELCVVLQEVGARLSAPGKDQIPLIRKLLGRMQDVRGRLEACFQETTIAQLVDDDPDRPDPARAWSSRQFLFWPIAPAPIRKRLFDYVSRYRAPGELRPVARRDSPRGGREVIDVDWAGLQIRTELLMKALRLSGGTATSKEYNMEDVESAFEELRKVADEQSKSDVPVSAPYWIAYRKLGKAIRRYFEVFLLDTAAAARRGRDLSAPETRNGRLAVLERAGKAQRLVHCHDARLLESVNPLEQLRAAHLYDMLVWHEQRFWLVRQSGVAQAEADALGAAARSYLLQASRIPDQPPPKPLEEKRLPLEFEGPREVVVPAERPADVEVIVRSRGEASSEAWVILAYDPELLDVGGGAAAGEQKLYHRHRLSSDPDLLSEPPSFNLSPGTPQRIRLQVNAKRAYEEPTKLVVMIKSEGLYSEYSAVVRLPTPETVEVALVGARDSWEATAEGFLLFPFPNAPTDFPLALKNRTERPLRAKVELYALPELPIGSLAGSTWPLDDQGRLLPDHPPLKLLGRLPEAMLPVGGVPVPLAFPKDAAPPPPPPPGKDAPGAAAPPPAKPLPPEVNQGMALVVTDLERDRAIVKRIRFAVQRPRRYLVPKAEYLPDQGRLQIVIKARNPSAMPPGGSKVAWIVGDELSEDVKVLREGKVEGPSWETTLYAEIGPNPRRVVNVVLEVDGFPRAFQIPVRLAESVGDTLPDDDLAQVAIAAPTPGSLFKSPLGKVPVQFRADAPVDAFQNKDDLLEIGFDLNNDRELYNERTWKFLSDRHATVALVEMLEGGGFRTLASASDFNFELDAPQLRNGAVAVLGKLSLRGRTVYSDSVPIRIDGAPPVIAPIGGLSAVEGQKEMLVVLEVADDVSGVDKVEVCVDPKRQARWAATKPVEAAYNLQGKWIAKLALDPYPPGMYQILVRAKDKVGNESETLPIDLIMSPKPPVKTYRIAGTVSFENEGREDVKVTLEGGPERKPITSEPGGVFRFDDLPAGKYKVKAEGVFKNKTRRAEQALEIAADANQVPPVRLVLK